jgi:hypothetical protein
MGCYLGAINKIDLCTYIQSTRPNIPLLYAEDHPQAAAFSGVGQVQWEEQRGTYEGLSRRVSVSSRVTVQSVPDLAEC